MYDVILMGNFFFFILVKLIIDEEIKSGILLDCIVLGNLRIVFIYIFISIYILCILFYII